VPGNEVRLLPHERLNANSALLVQCINAQYDSEASMAFYQYTMGGGSDYVHYGIFNSEADDLRTASHNAVLLLAELARRCGLLHLPQWHSQPGLCAGPVECHNATEGAC
jgi:hypothetical protein